MQESEPGCMDGRCSHALKAIAVVGGLDPHDNIETVLWHNERPQPYNTPEFESGVERPGVHRTLHPRTDHFKHTRGGQNLLAVHDMAGEKGLAPCERGRELLPRKGGGVPMHKRM
jgi:hypothetical protein